MPNVERVRTVMTGVAGAPYYHHYYCEAGVYSPDAIQARAHAGWNELRAEMTEDLTITTETEIETVDEVTGQILETNSATAPISNPGLSTANMAAFTTQGLGRLTTGVYINGRQLRGRFFVPGMTTDNILDGVPGANVITRISNCIDEWLAGSGPNVYVWSRTHGQAHPATGGSPWSQFAILRSRRD